MRKKFEYSNGALTIVWQPELCAHAGVCVKMLPQVYRPSKHPWIEAKNASAEQLMAQIRQCPSGALSYKIQTESTSEHKG